MASICASGLGYVYMRGTPLAHRALTGVSFSIEAGASLGVLGPTGCGKSTLIQHFNALLRPTEGELHVLGHDTRQVALGRAIRQQVGLVFQFPEAQIFEETVHAELAFGPRNMGLAEADVTPRVERACALMGLDFEAMRGRSPFALSGGEKRRVAIASVLAMDPPLLVLDEPTAGLDPAGRRECVLALQRLHREGKTLVLVSHELDVVAAVTTRVLVLDQGRLVWDGSLKEGLRRRLTGLRPTEFGMLCQRLAEAGWAMPPDVVSAEEAALAVQAAMPQAGRFTEPGPTPS
jgi:energy-coupling factor transport system ATP-binding protein